MEERIESETIDGLYRVIDKMLDDGWREKGKVNQRRETIDQSTGPIIYYADMWKPEP